METNMVTLNKPILITGASGGIGHEVVKKLIEQGYDVVAVDRDVSSLTKTSDKVYTLSYDLNDIDAFRIKLTELIKEHGSFGGFVHCAGFDKLSPLYLNKLTDLESLFKIHVFSAMSIISLLSKKGNLIEGSSIVLISSLSAHEGASGHTMYASAKGAIEGFIPSAASELSPKKIRINAIVPGVVQTQMSAGFIGRLDEQQLDSLVKSYPLGLGSPTNIADLIVFLLSEKSSWITGQKFIIDGGHTIRSV